MGRAQNGSMLIVKAEYIIALQQFSNLLHAVTIRSIISSESHLIYFMLLASLYRSGTVASDNGILPISTLYRFSQPHLLLLMVGSKHSEN